MSSNPLLYIKIKFEEIFIRRIRKPFVKIIMFEGAYVELEKSFI
jgi:hypothetical protein